MLPNFSFEQCCLNLVKFKVIETTNVKAVVFDEKIEQLGKMVYDRNPHLIFASNLT
tara:strand:+ start:602 stop:769 length:168 start_codon:yes stop_codon:yes gene_type:complete